MTLLKHNYQLERFSSVSLARAVFNCKAINSIISICWEEGVIVFNFPMHILRQERRGRAGLSWARPGQAKPTGREVIQQRCSQLFSTAYLSRSPTSTSSGRLNTLWASAMTLKPWLVYVLSSSKKSDGTVYRIESYVVRMFNPCWLLLWG